MIWKKFSQLNTFYIIRYQKSTYDKFSSYFIIVDARFDHPTTTKSREHWCIITSHTMCVWILVKWWMWQRRHFTWKCALRIIASERQMSTQVSRVSHTSYMSLSLISNFKTPGTFFRSNTNTTSERRTLRACLTRSRAFSRYHHSLRDTERERLPVHRAHHTRKI